MHRLDSSINSRNYRAFFVSSMGNLYHYFCFILIIFLTLKLLTQRKHNLPPSPLSLPFIGHFHLLRNPLYKSLAALLSKYGPILYLRLGSRRVLVLSSPSAVEECFCKNDMIFANRPPTMAGDILMYDGRSYVWAPHGPLWRNLRRVSVVEVLSSINVQKFSYIREDEVGHLVRCLFEDSAGSCKVDLKCLFGLLTMNVMLKMASGEAAARDREAEKMVFEEFKSMFFPSLGTNICDFFPVLKWIGFQGIEKGLKELYRRRDEYLQKLVDEIRLNRSRTLHAAAIKNPSLIEKLLSFQEEDPQFFSNEVIKGMALESLSRHYNGLAVGSVGTWCSYTMLSLGKCRVRHCGYDPWYCWTSFVQGYAIDGSVLSTA
ncbi:hypothetical protein V6N13_146798 [Hibiscus sabdariffa]